METYVFGVGAAGNKAAVDLVTDNIVNTQSVTLINTNDGDMLIEQDIQKIKLESEFQGGAAKDPNVGRAAMLNYLAEESNVANLYNSIPEDVDFVTIITSVEGGTGSGATPILADYIANVLEIPVHLFAFIGFHNEQVGMNNTIEFMKNLIVMNNVTIHIIQNDKFDAPTYKLKEKAANKYVGELMNIIKGVDRESSSQNIDEADAYKLFTTPGIMGIVKINCGGKRSRKDMDLSIVEAFDKSVEADYGGDAKRLAMILNASEATQQIFDDTLKTVRYYTNSNGGPEERYRHIQYNGTMQEYCIIVAAGMSPSENYINYLISERNKFAENSSRDSNNKKLLQKLQSATATVKEAEEKTHDDVSFFTEKTELPTIRKKKRRLDGSFKINAFRSSDSDGDDPPKNPMSNY